MKNNRLIKNVFAIFAAVLVFASCTPTAPVPPEIPDPALIELREAREASMSAKNREYYERYIRPYAGSGLFGFELNTGGFQDTVTEGMTRIFPMLGPDLEELAETHSGKIPADIAEAQIKESFDISPEELRTIAGGDYDADNKVYTFDPARLTEDYYEIVTDVEEGDWTTISASAYSTKTGKLVFTHKLTYDTALPYFKMLINSVTAMGEDETALIRVDAPKLPIFVYSSKEGLYTAVNADAPGLETYGDFIKKAAELAGKPGFEILSFTAQKGFGELELSREFLNSAFADQAAEMDVLNTVAMSLSKTLYIHDLKITVDGEAYNTAVYDLSPTGMFSPAEFTLGRFTAEEYTALRTAVSPGMVVPYFMTEGDMSVFINPVPDEETKQLLFSLYCFGFPDKELASPADLENEYKITRAIEAVKPVMLYDGYAESEFSIHDETLLPIAVAVSDEMFVLKEHIEYGAESIFGPDVTVEHQTVGRWTFHPEEGVYTPPHMGGAGSYIPVLHSVKKEGDGKITATVSYYITGYSLMDEKFNEIPESEIGDYIQNKAPRYEVVLVPAGDGSPLSYIAVSHKKAAQS